MMGKCLECHAHCTVITYLIYKFKKEQSHRGSYKRLNFFVLPKYQQFSSGNQRLLLAWPIPLTCICSFYILLIGSTCVTGINFAFFPDFSIGFQNSSATVFFFYLILYCHNYRSNYRLSFHFRYRISLVPDHEYEISASLVMRAKNGIPITLEKR